MKAIKLAVPFIALAVISSVSFSTLAATEVRQAEGTKIATVTAQTQHTVDMLTVELSKKADEAGGKTFKIISVNENSRGELSGTAEVY